MKGKLKKITAVMLAAALGIGGYSDLSLAEGAESQSEDAFVSETEEKKETGETNETDDIEESGETNETEETNETQETSPVFDSTESSLDSPPIAMSPGVLNAPAVTDTAYNKISIEADASQRYFTINVTDISESNIKNIYIPVWSQKGGQDDIRWYLAEKFGDSQWRCVVDVMQHKSDTGKYEAHVYAELADGSQKFLNAEYFSVQGIHAGTVSADVSDSAQGRYRLEIRGLTSPAGIQKMDVPVWSEKGGQDDLVWYEAKVSGDLWYVDVDIKNHNYEAGTYVAHVYATDHRNINALAGNIKFETVKMAGNQLQVELTSDQSRAVITLKNAQLPAGTEYVSIPVWGSAGGQNDILWYRANKLDAYSYQVTVPISNHKENGTYEAHAYAVLSQGTILINNCKFKVQGMSGAMGVTQDEENGYFTVTVKNIAAPSPITEVNIPVWSQKGGQDDIQWYKASKSGDSWSIRVDIGKHKMDEGTYHAHAYAKDSRGIEGLIANTTISVKKPTALPELKVEMLADKATVNVTLSNIIGADAVKLPVWGEKEGQNDIIWYDMIPTDTRSWKATISLGNHMEIGKYQIHAYPVINGSMQLAANATFKVDEIVVNDIQISGQNTETGAFNVTVQNISAIPNVDTVLVGVWSAKNSQDDLVWYPAKYANGKWMVSVNTKNHLYDRGIYYVHAYAYNAAGQSAFVGGVTTDVIINGKLGFVREGTEVYYYPDLNVKAYGFDRIDGERYYFDPSTGAMTVGWRYIDGYKYYFDGDGKMLQDIDALIGLQSSYILKINKQANCVTMYAYDPATASYCIPVKSMLCSTGDDTPIGTYPLRQTYRWLLMYNGTYSQFLSLITGDFLIHSITYEAMNNRTLLTVGYNQLGVNKSAGCVRLRCGEAYWIYNLVNAGRLRQVTIYNSSNPGPFDRPYVAPIPDDQRWDPTDPTL